MLSSRFLFYSIAALRFSLFLAGTSSTSTIFKSTILLSSQSNPRFLLSTVLIISPYMHIALARHGRYFYLRAIYLHYSGTGGFCRICWTTFPQVFQGGSLTSSFQVSKNLESASDCSHILAISFQSSQYLIYPVNPTKNYWYCHNYNHTSIYSINRRYSTITSRNLRKHILQQNTTVQQNQQYRIDYRRYEVLPFIAV